MTEYAYNRLTLADLAIRRDPNGEMAAIAEILNRDNPILQHMPVIMANDVFNHKMVRRSYLPTGSFRRLNAGVATEKSETTEVTEGLGMLESYAEIDKTLADAAPDPMQFRMDEAAAFIEGMGQTLATKLFYGNHVTDPEEFDGLAVRMPDIDADGNVINQGGTGSDLTSIYIVQWGATRVFGLYPRGDANMGIRHDDLGEVTLQDASGNNYQGYRDHFQVRIGLAVKDSRCIARLANIESTGSSNTFDEDNLIKLINRMPMEGAGAVIYVNTTVKSQIDIKAKNQTNVNYSSSELFGVPVTKFRGIPIRKCDAILDTEDALT